MSTMSWFAVGSSAAWSTPSGRSTRAAASSSQGNSSEGLPVKPAPREGAAALASLDCPSCRLKAVQPHEWSPPDPMEARSHPLPPPTRPPPAPRAAARGTALVPAVSRALALLERLAGARTPMSLARLATDLALPKSSVHGLCNTLVSFGYLRRQSDGAFLIGPRVMGLAEAFVSGTDVAQEFNALWTDGGAEPDESVVLSVLSGGDALYVGVRNSARPLGLKFTVGMRL